MPQDARDSQFARHRENRGLSVAQLLIALVVGGGLTAAVLKGPEWFALANENFGGTAAGTAPARADEAENGAWRPDPQLAIGFAEFTPDANYVYGHTIALQGPRIDSARCQFLQRSNPSIEALEDGGCASAEQVVGLRRMQAEARLDRESTD